MEGVSENSVDFIGEQEMLGIQREVVAEWEKRSLMDALKEIFIC